MVKVFLDANIYFSTSRSKTGGSSVMFMLIDNNKLKLFASKEVIKEAEKNIRLKEPLSTRIRFYELLENSSPKIIKINKKLAEKKYSKIINTKDSVKYPFLEDNCPDFLLLVSS